jgi:HSP20 family molecular chaperone IbpA
MWTSDFPIWLPPVTPPVSLTRDAPAPDALLSTRWSEDRDAYDLAIDLPGFRRRNVTLEIHGDVLDVRAEREKGFWSKEHHAIHHVVTLPAGADRDAVQASLRDGRLAVRVLKRPEARTRTIPIRVNGELPPPASRSPASLTPMGSPWLRAVNRIRDALRSAVESVKAAHWRRQDV